MKLCLGMLCITMLYPYLLVFISVYNKINNILYKRYKCKICPIVCDSALYISVINVTGFCDSFIVQIYPKSMNSHCWFQTCTYFLPWITQKNYWVNSSVKHVFWVCVFVSSQLSRDPGGVDQLILGSRGLQSSRHLPGDQ